MKIAGISLTFNDGYKIKEWKNHYEEYKDDLDYFVIVDNASERKYYKELCDTFERDAVILRRGFNGGCTAAYNDGIRYVLENTDANALIIIGNDMKLSENCIHELCSYLYSDEKLGIVSALLLYKDSDIVEDFGHRLQGLNIIFCDNGRKLCEFKGEEKYTDLVAGGFYMAKREFYEMVGLQDEKLFMYGDEIDTSIRARKAGYKIGITSKCYAWHWHIDNPIVNDRFPASDYLMSRNRVYLASKHFSDVYQVKTFLSYTIKKTLAYFFVGIKSKKKKYFTKAQYCFLGGINGLVGNMNLNRYTKFE